MSAKLLAFDRKRVCLAAHREEETMKCRNCGAKIRKNDRFCPACGLSRDPGKDRNAYPGSGAGKEGRTIQRKMGLREIREPLYDEHLYKDSFLEERREERSQALLITLAILLLVALLGAGFLTFYFMIRQKRAEMASPGGTDWSVAATGDPMDGDHVITIFPETEPPRETEALPQTEEMNGGEAAETEPDSQRPVPPQDVQSETDAVLTETADPTGKIDFTEIARLMEEYGEAQAYGVCVYDLKEKKVYVAGDGSLPMYTSAAVTVPVLYTAAALLDEGTVTMEDPIPYVNSIGGRGEADPQQRDGKDFPLSYYLQTMLTYSDNNCINVLIDAFGLEEINRICHEGGFSSVDIQRKIVAEVTDGSENYVSAADLGGMVRDLYSGKFTSIGKAFLETYFRIDESDEGRTVIGLAEGVRDARLFLNQDGMGDTRFAEAAVVEDDACSYIISEMMTGEEGFAYIDAGIAISAYVYEALSQP